MQSQTASYVLTTLIVPPASLALTTLTNVKDELGLPTTDPSNDDRLNRWILEESSGIARYCNRIFGLAMWQDEFRPQRGVGGEGVRGATNPLKLSKFPLANGAAIVVTGTTHGNVSIDGIASTVGITKGMLAAATDGSIPAGAVVTRVNPTSLFLSQAATGSVVGLQLSFGMNVVETVASTSTWLQAKTDYQVDMGTLLPGDEGVGRIFRLNQIGQPRTWPAAIIQVLYQSGYTLPTDDDEDDCCVDPNLPADLEGACIKLVVRRYRASGRDPMLVERSQPGTIGGERYWVGATPGQRGPYPNEIMDVLDDYRIPVVG